ncbi:MAG TPA: glycosyl hydrolase [Solirubrobacteraceae bacterium]|nr:glycosyl hydrolase [Solirubrobacteraceae bacterium]
MAFRKMLPLAVLASLLVVSTAEAKYRVGIGDQSPAMFDSARWQSLKLKRTRYLVPWNWNKDAGQRAEVEAFMNRARSARQQVLVTFMARRGCWNGRRYSRSRACRAPSAKAYRSSFGAFDNEFPWVKTYSAWNEVNHASQPTYRKPGLAVRYYEVLRKQARKRKFKVMAADVLDTSNMSRYLRSFMRKAKGSPRLWGLHNYQDVNRKTSADTRRMLALVRGEVWLTETGGIVKFQNFRYSPSRAAARTKWMFTLANRYDSRKRGMRAKVTQLFVYRWFGEPRSARFDAGLVHPNGKPRKAYNVVRKYSRTHR